MLSRIRLFLDTIKFAHTLFALPFAAVAAFWARRGWPRWDEAALLLAAMVAARTAAMACNRVADAKLDALNPRTRDRAIPAGKLSRRSVAVAAAVAAAAFVACAVAFLPLAGNPWPAILCAPVLAVLCGYSYTKRFTVASHWVLGAALGLSPVGVWIAMTGRIDVLPVLLGAAVAVWTAGFDILYSLQDIEHDRACGLHSVPARWGAGTAITVSRVNHVAAILLLAAAYLWPRVASPGEAFAPGRLYLIAVAALAALLVYEHRLVRADDLSKIDRAFFSVNATGSVIFAVLAVTDVLL
ncbi:MAG: UbiA family prenyltransferase [Planctomycetes bacterium]|nr:UbiA family prenyltransferase [Planctomycetota bacterium]